MTAGFCQGDWTDVLRSAGLDTVEGAFAYAGGDDLTKSGLGGRRRTRLTLPDKTGTGREVYLKRYTREKLSQRLRRQLTYGRRRSPAGVEFANIRAARQAHLATMEAIAFGEEFDRLGAARSYLVVTAVPGDAIERVGADFITRHAEAPMVIERLTRDLAEIVRTLHRAGYVHRDLYASHIFLHERGDGFSLYLIDLARMFAPRWRRFRWRVKDLAQLKYSMPAQWVNRHWDAFLVEYLDGGEDIGRWITAVDGKADAIRRRQQRKSREKTGEGRQQ